MTVHTKIIALVLCLAMIITNILSVCAESSADYSADIGQIADRQSDGLIADENGSLRLDDYITRAEFAVLMNKTVGFYKKVSDKYKDISKKDWYYDDIMAAIEAGYLQGDENNEIRPNELITKEEAAAMMYKIYHLNSKGDNSKLFADQWDISEWADAAVQNLTANNIFENDGYYFEPNANVTRADAALMAQRLVSAAKSDSVIDFSDPQRSILSEDFESNISGSFPKNWDSTAYENIEIQADGDGNKHLYIDSKAADPVFTKSSKALNYGISRFFSPVSGNLTLEFDFKTDETKGKKILPSLSSDKSAESGTQQKIFEISSQNGVLYASSDSNSINLKKIQTKQWYHIRIDIDTDTQSYDVYLNNEMLKTDLKFIKQAARIGNIQYYVDKDSIGTLYLDNINLSAQEGLFFKNGGTLEKTDSKVAALNFDNYTAGEKPPITSYSGTSKLLVKDYDDSKKGKYFYYEKAAQTGAHEYITTPFGKTFSGNVEITFKVCATDVTSNYKSIYLGNMQIPVQLTGSYIMSGGSSAYESLVKDTWYDVKVVTNTAKQLYDLYVNGKLCLRNVPYLSSGTSLSSFMFVMEKTSIGSVAIDDMLIKQLGNVDLQIERYVKNKISGAGKKGDYTSKFLPKLDGTIVEAEDMELSNYTTVSNNSAHNGKGIEVSRPGIGTAQYVFTGEEGYYAIRVGYYEKLTKSEAISKVYINGKEIDYWFSQNDDNLLHVRDVKSDYYLQKGDVIVLEGYFGYDPSPFDFLQITAPVKANFKRGYLAYEQYASWTSWNAPGWDFSEKGGAVRKWGFEGQYYTLNFMDINKNESVWGRRRFQKQEKGLLTANVKMIFEKKTDGIQFDLCNGKTSAISVVTDNGNICYLDEKGQKNIIMENYPVNTGLVLSITADLDNRTAYIMFGGGENCVSGVKFLNEISALDNLYVETSVEDTAHFAFITLEISAGYLLNENFMMYKKDDTQLQNWNLTGNNTKIDIINSNPFYTDNVSLTLKGSSGAKRNFPEQNGKVTAEFELMIDNILDETTVTIGSSSGVGVKFKSVGGNLCCEKSDGTSEIVWANFKNHLWYHIGIVLDAGTKTFAVEVNNIAKADNVPFFEQINTIDNVQFESNRTGLFWIDDITVFKGIYESNVPKPEPVDTGDVTVGVQTCDLWNEGEHFGWDCVRPYDNRTPYLGYYTDNDPEVADWETKWMVEHGINLRWGCFFRPGASNFDYPIKRPLNSAYLHDGYFNSKYKDMLKFGIMFENSNFASSEEDFLQNVVRYWIERYFKNPQYYKFNNMPVVSIYRHDLMSKLLGSDANVKATLDKVREMVKAEGFDGIIINTVLYETGDASSESHIKSMGFDYTYQYGFGGRSIEEQVAKAYQQQKNGIIDGIGVLTQGYGAEPWGYSGRKTNASLNDWNNALAWFKNYYMPKYDEKSLAGHVILLDNWNEIAEGHFIAPSNICGFGYLDEIRRVFGTGGFEHTDSIPSQVGLGPYDYRAENILR